MYIYRVSVCILHTHSMIEYMFLKALFSLILRVFRLFRRRREEKKKYTGMTNIRILKAEQHGWDDKPNCSQETKVFNENTQSHH